MGSDAHLEPYQKSMMEAFYENSWRLIAVNSFHIKLHHRFVKEVLHLPQTLFLWLLSVKKENNAGRFNYIKCAAHLKIQWRLIFANVIHCSRLRLWGGYFIYFEFTRSLEFSGYKIELQDRVTLNDITLWVINSKMFIEILLSSY